MSGIVGILQRDGTAVDGGQLQRLAALLQYRGPDALNIWTSGAVGFGHALLLTRGAKTEAGLAAAWQPARLDAPRICITADARLDARGQLRAEILAAGQQTSQNDSDAQLILRAYAAWGAECVHRLRGDFAFALWDEKTATLFCARDHFGIKPFYYAACGELFLFSNTLQVLLAHPRVSGELNEFAVGDFLLFGLNCDNSTSTFRDIQRLPPGHSLQVSRDTLQLRRYWELPVDGRIRYARAEEYVEQFRSVWDSAMADRLDSERVGILLSGGLDSAAVAATGKELSAHSPNSCDFRAYTVVHNRLSQDRDPANASVLAASLGIPARFIAMDDLRLFERFDATQPIAPEPVDDPLFAGLFLTFEIIAEDCRVVFSGEGADNLMHFQMWPYVADLRRSGEWRRLIREVLKYGWRRPFPWRGIRARAKGFFGVGNAAKLPFPKWIAPEFAQRLDLPARWREGQPLPPKRHPIHPIAHASLYLPQWTSLFELENSGVTRCPIEVRYPFLDLRVVEYLLAIPPFPWFFQKTLLREAMVGRVLDTVRCREKTPFVGDPVLEHLRRAGRLAANGPAANGEANRVAWSEEAGRYINRSSFSALHAKMTTEQVEQSARPICFNFWLQSVRGVRYN